MHLNIINNKYLIIWLEQSQSLKYWRNITHIILCLKYTEDLGTLRGFKIKEKLKRINIPNFTIIETYDCCPVWKLMQLLTLLYKENKQNWNDTILICMVGSVSYCDCYFCFYSAGGPGITIF